MNGSVPRSTRLRKWLYRSLALLLLLTGAGFGYYRYYYPYGYSHCCDINLYLQLWSFAEEHDGWFPRGESSPEASLSLLSRIHPFMAENLRGKTVPREQVEKILVSGGLLDPTTCGWHYLEGLRKDDPGELLLLWDKAGLDHYGRRLNGDRTVKLISGTAYITAQEWPAFLERQRQLLVQLPKRDPQPRLPVNP